MALKINEANHRQQPVPLSSDEDSSSDEGSDEDILGPERKRARRTPASLRPPPASRSNPAPLRESGDAMIVLPDSPNESDAPPLSPKDPDIEVLGTEAPASNPDISLAREPQEWADM